MSGVNETSCDFHDQFGTHADMTGDGIATCCDGGPVLPALDDERLMTYVLAKDVRVGAALRRRAAERRELLGRGR